MESNIAAIQKSVLGTIYSTIIPKSKFYDIVNTRILNSNKNLLIILPENACMDIVPGVLCI